ncbi:long polar fimbrial outer membrane usher protein LpfC [Serratia fonticola]|nr:long polar fimbrial outer membrane usher protein LpfC [Serratia fonticola]CAI1180168.1 long polar fimbrial outer membrane usher protein LpfC [Serratia fonticola]
MCRAIIGQQSIDLFVKGDTLLVYPSRQRRHRVNGKLQPQLTASYLGNIGVKLAAFPPLQQLPVEQPVTDLGRYIPQAGSQVDFTQQRLNLSIPQAALSNEGASAG